MDDDTRIHVALVGSGPWTERLAHAVEVAGGVIARPTQEAASPDALIVAGIAGDGYARARDALCAGTPVLVGTPSLLSPWQVNALHELARRHGTPLRFLERFAHRPELRFLGRLVGGHEPFWQPLYLRVLRTADADRGSALDTLASETIALCDALLHDAPRQVTATASAGQELGEVSAVFLTATYRRGPTLQCTVSLAEPPARWELTVAAPGRTISFDVLRGRDGLRVTATDQHDLLHTTSPLHEARSTEGDGYPVQVEEAGLLAEVRRFLEAARTHDTSVTNADRWTRVAAVWWAARQSLSFGGPVDVVVPRLYAREAAPPLRVIEGGGGSAREVERPALAVVPR